MKEREVTVSLEELCAVAGLRVVEPGCGSVTVSNSGINRPGLQFSGYFMHFAAKRIQIIGNAEMDYLRSLDTQTIRSRLETFAGYPIPCIIFSRGHEPLPVLLQLAKRSGIPILAGDGTTTGIGHKITGYLDRLLAPSIVMHGVLMDVFGVGVLFTGESGIGKSETALEMLRGGHRLVADDVVNIRRVSDRVLMGSAPEATRFLMEIRGLGVIDVRHLYGMSAVIPEKQIHMVVELETWQQDRPYERMDFGKQQIELLNIPLTHILMPVRPGRNIAIITEVAARNYRLKAMGYDSAENFTEKWEDSIQRK